jgi:hypothetical protein
MCLKIQCESADTPAMRKWQSEAEMNAELRRMASEMRQLKEELRSYIAGESACRRGQLPTEDDRKLRRIGGGTEQQGRT